MTASSNSTVQRPTLCIGVLTLNEARHIDACLVSAAFADQLIVMDSGSTDATCDRARALGAEVFVEADWQGFAVQRNRVLRQVRCDYIFFLDADEVIPSALQQEIQTAVAQGANAVWQVQWEQVAFGRPLSAMQSTGGIARLFWRANVREFTGVVHEGASLVDPQVPTHRFKTRLLHYSRETVYESLRKLAQYVQLGAAKRMGRSRGGIARGFASALAMFIRLYIVRRGFLCGPEGFLFCFMVALDSFFKYVALKYDAYPSETLVKR